MPSWRLPHSPVAISTSIVSVWSDAFVGASCTSLAVAIAIVIVAIIAIVGIIATIRATPVASSALAKLFASRSLLIVVELVCALSRRRRSRSLRPTFTLRQCSLLSTIVVLAALSAPRGHLFVDCRVRCVQLSGNGGHNRDHRDHCQIVIVVSTAMRPSSRLPSHICVFFHALAQRSLLVRLLSHARWSRLLRRSIDNVVVIIPHNRCYHRCCSSRSTLSPLLLLAVDVRCRRRSQNEERTKKFGPMVFCLKALVPSWHNKESCGVEILAIVAGSIWLFACLSW